MTIVAIVFALLAGVIAIALLWREGEVTHTLRGGFAVITLALLAVAFAVLAVAG